MILDKLPFIFCTSLLPPAELSDALGKLEVFKASSYLGVALAGLGVYALIFRGAEKVWKIVTIWVLGVCFASLGLAPSLTQWSSPIQTSKTTPDQNPTQTESYVERQVRGTIRTVYTKRSGAMGVLLEIDDTWRAGLRKEYEKKNKNKPLGNTYIGSRSIDPNIRVFLLTAYYTNKPIVITVNGLTADGDWYQLKDAHVGHY